MIIGPFIDFEKNPIFGSGSGFYFKGVYNPAVVKDKGSYFMLFRAESLVLLLFLLLKGYGLFMQGGIRTISIRWEYRGRSYGAFFKG